ncbi:MAG: class I SAM-dependent methyltransferase, partial [Pseudomonadota bacterium]
MDFGTTSDVKALRSIFNPDGLKLVDVGCGAGDLARKLAYVGATVLGVEPDSVQAQKNAAADPVDNVEFVEAVAHEMPVDDHSVDGVIFSLSLHHVPQTDMQASLEKACRALKPDGFLAAVEPLFEGSYNDCIELFHNEQEVRENAIAALEKYARPAFSHWQQYFYTTEARYPDFAAFTDRYVNMTYNSFDPDIVRSDAVRERFERCRDGDDYLL